MNAKYQFRTLVSVLLLTAVTLGTSAQDNDSKPLIKPNFKEIVKTVKDKKSPYYYPTLFKRYLDGDNTMTDMEKFYTYYGYLADDDYEPYGLSVYEDSLRSLMKLDSLSTADTKKALFYLDDILAQDPFDIQMLLNQAFMYKSLKMNTEAQKTFNKMSVVMSALIQTGDALSKKTAIYVINIHQEYDYMYAQGFDPQSQDLTGHYDHFILEPNEENISHMYFDISAFINK